MRAVVNVHQLPDGDLCVPLRRREALVAEHLLNSPQVGALSQQVRGERVAKRVRTDSHVSVGAVHTHVALEDPVNYARSEPPAVNVEEKRGATGARFSKQLFARGQVSLERRFRFRAERHDPLFIALAAHQNKRIAEIHASEIKPCKLTDAQARSVEQFEDGAVPYQLVRGAVPKDRGIPGNCLNRGGHAVEKSVHFLFGHNPRQLLFKLGRRDRGRRIVCNQPLAREELEERADRGQLARDGRLLLQLLKKVRKKRPYPDGSNSVHIHGGVFILLRKKIAKLHKVTAIIADRVRGSVALVFQVLDVTLDQVVHEIRVCSDTSLCSE